MIESVRYWRLLLNSALAGCLMAAYLAVLFLQINPAVLLRPGTVGPLYGVLLLSYGLLFAFVCYVAIVIRQLLATEPLSPGWVSFRVLVWLSVVASGIVATLMWLNLRGLRLSLPDEAARHMAQGAALLTLCAALLLVLALLRYSVGQRSVSLGVAGFVTVLVVSLVGPFWLRGGGRPPLSGAPPAQSGQAFEAASSPARVVMLLIDGASLDFISPAAADGRLPNFGRVLDTGAVMHLATLRPTQPGPVWTAVATGKLPFRNGVRSAAVYRMSAHGPTLDLLPDFCFAHALVYFGLVDETPQTSASLRARPLWSILRESGVESAVVRWPLTSPAREPAGIVVSDRMHAPDVPAAAHVDVTVRDQGEPATMSKTRSAPQPGLSPAAPADSAGSLALDRLYAERFDTIASTPGLRLLALRYQGLDVVGHYYLRQAMPQTFGDVSDEERRKYGRVLEQYYRYLDGEVGRRIDRLAPDDLLLIVSGFGMEPLSLPKRILERLMGARNVSGTHERAPDGFLMAYGTGVRAGHLPRASVIDVAPTVLYFFGLPIGRDMDGFARTDIFSRAFTEERPLTYIPTYE
jgi:hypothetical protein